MAISSTQSAKNHAISGAVIARDGAAIALAALALGSVVSNNLSPIIASAGPPMLLVGILVLALPAALFARARGHHGVLRSALWGVLLALPFAFLALISGSLAESARYLGLGSLGGVLTWLAVKAQALPTLLFPERCRVAAGYVVATLVGASVLIISLQGLIPRAQPERLRTVAAVEVPLRGEADRAALVALFQRHAERSGLHVDDGSEEWRQFEQRANQIASEERVTFSVSVWRGGNDDENEALADDRFHPGRVWVIFPRGSEPDRSRRFREPLVAELTQRWPEARPIPILPWGGLPHARDLVLTDDGYRIARSAAADYGLAPSLPIFTSE